MKLDIVRTVGFYVLYLPLIYCADSKERLSNLKGDLLYEVAKYLDRPYEHLGNLSKTVREMYLNGRISQILVSERLCISEIGLIDEDDGDEMNELLALTKYKDKTYELFVALSDAIFKRNICPKSQLHLLKFLRNIFIDFEADKKAIFKYFEDSCAKKLTEKGEFSQMIEWFDGNSNIFTSNICNLSHELKKEIYTEIVDNENLLNIFKQHLQNGDNNNRLYLISDAILYNVPGWQYLITDHNEVVSLFLHTFAFNLSETENADIYLKFDRIIEDIQTGTTAQKSWCKLLNRIRFGAADDINIGELGNLLSKEYVFLGLKLAHFGGKLDTFRDIVTNCKAGVINSLLVNIPYCNDLNVFKIYCKVLEILGRKIPKAEFLNSRLFIFLKQNFFVDELKEFGTENQLEITFKSSFDLLEAGYPETIKLVLDISQTVCSYFILEFWRYFKTETDHEDKLKNLLLNFFNIKRVSRYISGLKTAKYKHFVYNPRVLYRLILLKDFKEGYEYGNGSALMAVTYETAKMIFENEYLRTIIKNYELRIYLTYAVTRELIKSPIGSHNLSVYMPFNEILECLKSAKTCQEISRLEKLLKMTVSEIILSRNCVHDEHFYYQLRHVLVYWLNGPHKQEINELPNIVKDKLEFEYPEIVNEINEKN